MHAVVHGQATYPDAILADVLRRMLPKKLHGGTTPWRVGVTGLQGSGKSTLAAQLGLALEQRGVSSVSFSLDDFYLTHAERMQLARDVHPLLATRGVPGTHDVEWLRRTLDQLASASASRPVVIPRFDKRDDDRASATRWQQVDAVPDVILLDGWCIGVTAQNSAELDVPINALERDEDRNGAWRRWVNGTLHEEYEPLWQSLDYLVALQAPSFDVVESWRGQSERAGTVDDQGHGMPSAALRRFVAHYERLSRHALMTLPDHADLLLRLDSARNVITVEPVSDAAGQ